MGAFAPGGLWAFISIGAFVQKPYFGISIIIILRKIRRFWQIIVWIPRKLSILSSELHPFCSHKDFQSKAPILLCKSRSSYRKKVKLRFELQGKCMIFWVPDSFPLICQKHRKFAAPFLDPLQAVHFEFGAPRFFPRDNSQLRALILLCKTILSRRKIHKLRFELQGNCAKHNGLILLFKIRCFLKRTQFGTYFELPVGSSPICKDFVSKRRFFCIFAISQWRAREQMPV